MTTTYEPAEVFTPGEYLRDELEERGWSVTEFAEILGRPIQAISEILNGKKEITVETALDIASALDTSPELWLNLQTSYRLHQARSETTTPSVVSRRSRLRALGPTAEMRRRGWLPDTDDLDALESAAKRLLRIESLDDSPQFAVAARRSNTTEPLNALQLAWLGRMHQLAEGKDAPAFDIEATTKLAAKLPQLLRDGPAAMDGLTDLLRECGVILLVEPGLKGSKLDGAAFFLDSGTAVVALTGRYDRFDSLLFTLLHELAHLILGHVTLGSGVLVDEELEETDAGDDGATEQAANDQAADWVFPGGLEFTGPATASTISGVAASLGVHPSLVIGRLQRDRVITWSRFRGHIPKVRPYLDRLGE